MDKEQIIREINSGKKRIVSKLEYFLIYWALIFAVVSTLLGGVFWFANANGRMFTSEDIKYETEKNTINARQRTFDKLDERYMKRNEMLEFKESMKELSGEIKDLRKELSRVN